jgi:hypothetical protein
MERLTKKEALEKGYSLCGFKNREYQLLQKVADLNKVDFSEPIFLASIEPFYIPSIDAETIADILADHMYDQVGEQTNDDTNEVHDIVKKLDFSKSANIINQALEDKKYYSLTDIELIYE